MGRSRLLSVTRGCQGDKAVNRKKLEKVFGSGGGSGESMVIDDDILEKVKEQNRVRYVR